MEMLSVNPHAEKLRAMGNSEGVLNVKSAFSKFVDLRRMAFTQWRRMLPRSRQMKKTFDAVLRMWANASLGKIMRRWQEHTMQRFELKRILQKVLLRWNVSSALTTFSRWSKRIINKRLLQRKGNAIADRHETEILFKALSDWYEAHLEELWFWDAHRVGDEHYKQKLSSKCKAILSAWREEQYWSKIRCHAAHQVRRRRQRIQIDNALDTWLTQMENKKALETSMRSSGAPDASCNGEPLSSARSTLSQAGEDLETTLDSLRAKLQAALAFRNVEASDAGEPAPQSTG